MNKRLAKFFAAAFALCTGVCTVFGGWATSYAADCTHTFSDSWTADGVNHWHASECGHDIVRDIAPHTFANGKCTVCGQTQPEPEHVHTYITSVWQSDGVNHWHASSCGHDIVTDIAPHTFSGGVCTVCGETAPQSEHRHTYNTQWEYDEVNHWHASECGHDIVKDIAPHTLNLSGECICGYKGEAGTEFTDCGAYSESLYAEWQAESIEGITAYYRPAGGNWTAVDDELIRISDGTARVDVVGISAGTYSIKISDGESEIQKDNIKVEAYDRSGYAHFNYGSGVGAYNDDGTPKANAQIIYVSEETKNTVTATIGGKEYTGIVPILTATPRSANPVIIRIIGTVGAAAWTAKKYTVTGNSLTPDDVIAQTPGANGAKLEKRDYTMKELLDGGFNTLDESVYSELAGLSDLGKMTYSAKEYDSAWNNCSIGGSASHPENITVEGIGCDAKIAQWGFTFRYATSVEVRNLTFDDYTEDACSFEGGTNSLTIDGFDSNRIWLHNCTFYEGYNAWDVCSEQDKGDGDGSTDFKRCAYVTISYNHYIETHKTGLIGGSDTQTTASVTFHHNYYDNCQSRLPLARQANMHMYNNYYYKTTNTCVDVRAGGFAFVEYCYYEDASRPALGTVGDNKQGAVKLYNCTFAGSTKLTQTDYVKAVANRTDTVANGNIFGQNFDTDPSLFYYDSSENRSAVTNLITDVSSIPGLIPQLAGANKPLTR